MKKNFYLCLLFTCFACSNSPEFETGEIKTLSLVTEALNQLDKPMVFLDARTLTNRHLIDKANTPVLFVELETGQNGTLTQYPGEGIGQTWLAADGATITFEQGVLKASRGMGNDVMGGETSMPTWSKINGGAFYKRTLGYLEGNNHIQTLEYDCKIRKDGKKQIITIWEVQFTVIAYEESCDSKNYPIKNTYLVENNQIVRKSYQFHSPTLGYIVTERLDRLN